MRLTDEQHEYLSKYLKNVGIEHQEPFEEFYDHIATGFEESHVENLKLYIRDIAQPAFGGTEGMLRVVKEQNKLRKSMIAKRAKEIFLRLFGWPGMLTVVLSVLLVLIGKQILGDKYLIIFTLSITLFVPALIILFGQAVFYFNCKRNKLPYRSNNLNHWILQSIHLPIIALNLGGNLIIPFFIGRDKVNETLVSYPFISITLCIFSLLFGIVYFKLIQEKFTFKIHTT
ncbi:MAG: hypothetical protein JJ978_18020 [Roseivirga sp.]|uniref:hypothetical protein n=1 Tax=Roseivirga sp. TaxID=1964215 RepID=UPI001AFEA13B|nr:hypothetical protein [Roseivirga sp.]MBO6497468.1 hypothetical protein [Roseivirga sp.]